MSQVAIGVLIPRCIRDLSEGIQFLNSDLSEGMGSSTHLRLVEMNQIYEIQLHQWQEWRGDSVEWVEEWYFQENSTGHIDPEFEPLGTFQMVNMAQVEPVVGTRLDGFMI